MSRLLTMNEASEYLAISKLTLYGWVSARKLGFVKVGRLVKFKQHDLDRWIDQHTVKARVEMKNFLDAGSTREGGKRWD
jgi:excisionase family DNA binding protein